MALESVQQVSAGSYRKGCVSIILCTRNRVKSLEATLASLRQALVPPDLEAELLLVDNGSTDATAELIATFELPVIKVRYLREARPGKGYAYNAGIAAAAGEVLLFTDDDVRVPADWIEGMCRPIVEGRAEAVQGGVRFAPYLERPWLTGALRVWLAAVEDPRRPPEGLVGANMAIGRKALEAVGGFDPRLGPGASGFYDDTIVGWAIERGGGKILYQPEVAVEHHFSADRLATKSFLKIARGMAVSRAIVMRTGSPAFARPSMMEFLRELPGFVVRLITQGAKTLTNRRPDPGFLVRYYRLCLWLALRRRQ